MGRVAAPIFTLVGLEGINAPHDVFVIQCLLNDRLPGPHAPVPVTGETHIGTTLAVETFQTVILSTTPSTGRIDSDSATYYALVAHPLVNAMPPKVGNFGNAPSEMIKAATASRKK